MSQIEFSEPTPEQAALMMRVRRMMLIAGLTTAIAIAAVLIAIGYRLFHLAGSAAPATCLPCHAGERPTSTTGWVDATYQASPFDYMTNASGITHGDGQDCALCHKGPGSGAWGSTQNWARGSFTHGPSTVSGTTCIACHLTQHPNTVITPSVTASLSTGGFLTLKVM